MSARCSSKACRPSLALQTIKLTPDGLTQTASVFLETSMPTHDDMARFSYARDESTLASPRLCISRGDSINCSGFGPEANGWLLRLPPVLETLHGFSMPPIALTPMLDKLADTSMGAIIHAFAARAPTKAALCRLSHAPAWEPEPERSALCDAEDRKLRAHAEAWARSFTRSPRGRASCKGSLVQTAAAWEGRA